MIKHKSYEEKNPNLVYLTGDWYKARGGSFISLEQNATIRPAGDDPEGSVIAEKNGHSYVSNTSIYTVESALKVKGAGCRLLSLK